MKKIIISLCVIGAVAVIAIGGTIAYFSDTETSTGNTFTAGTIDLKIDSDCMYNGKTCMNGHWNGTDETCSCNFQAKDLAAGDLFFNFSDIKPGDSGEDTVSLHVDNNDAYVCAEVSNLVSKENGCNEPEKADESACEADGVGELQDNIFVTIWRDNGVAGDESTKCDNKLQAGETVLVSNEAIGSNSGMWPLYTPQTGSLKGGAQECIGIAWNVPAQTGNKIQSDSVKADIIFRAEQARNNPNFVCGRVATKTLILDNKDPQTWARITNDSMQGTLTYNVAGSEFNYTFTATGLKIGTEYSLVYYADNQARFTDWGGDNPGRLIGTFTTDGSGNIATATRSIDLGMDLPAGTDWNATAIPNYCGNANEFDSYNTCTGAKIWLVPSIDYAEPKLTAWNPASYLFETDLIVYDDTNI